MELEGFNCNLSYGRFGLGERVRRRGMENKKKCLELGVGDIQLNIQYIALQSTQLKEGQSFSPSDVLAVAKRIYT